MQILVNGLLTSYERSGKGRQLLILHGWGDSSAGWRTFAAPLARKYEIILLDLPGFGATNTPGAVWGLDEYAQFIAAFLKKADVRPYAIIAHSNGGAIAIRAMAQDLLRTNKLILLASAGIRGDNKGRNTAIKVVAKAGKALTLPLPTSVKRRLRTKLYKTVGSDMLVAENLQETFKKVVTDNVLPDAAKIQTPTLLIYGDKDTSTPVRYGEQFMAVLPRAQLEVLPGIGHFVQMEAPEVVRGQLEKFLS